MSEESKRRARLRWVTLGEAVAIAAVAISGLTFYTSWQDRRDARTEKAAEASRTAAFALKASGGGATLTLAPVSADQAIQGQTVRFPPVLGLDPVTTTSDARIEAGWFADALKKDRSARRLPGETTGDRRLPVAIETSYLDGGSRAPRARSTTSVTRSTGASCSARRSSCAGCLWSAGRRRGLPPTRGYPRSTRRARLAPERGRKSRARGIRRCRSAR